MRGWMLTALRTSGLALALVLAGAAATAPVSAQEATEAAGAAQDVATEAAEGAEGAGTEAAGAAQGVATEAADSAAQVSDTVEEDEGFDDWGLLGLLGLGGLAGLLRRPARAVVVDPEPTATRRVDRVDR